MTGLTVLAAQQEQLPEDVGKAGPIGLTLIVALLIATILLVRSMGGHLKKLPRSFGPDDEPVEIPDTPAELIDGPRPGDELLDTLRRAPLAIEPPRRPQDGNPRDGGQVPGS
ncbi:hypothetical protein HGI15_15390 [Modestobacter lapidis]|nr:hypothetical protein [Modestobacter lapidis]